MRIGDDAEAEQRRILRARGGEAGEGRDNAAAPSKRFSIHLHTSLPAHIHHTWRRIDLFENIEFFEEFDGVWANACLLHVPRPSLSAILSKIHRALRAGGVLYASFKTGAEEGIDQYGRYYNYPDEAFLRGALGGNWSSVNRCSKRRRAITIRRPTGCM